MVASTRFVSADTTRGRRAPATGRLWAVLWRTASQRLNESLFLRSESSRPGPPRPSRLHPAAMDRSQGRPIAR